MTRKKNKKDLIVTLADRNYITQAKAWFSNVYFNAGWKGDYMLLAHEVPDKDLRWFKNKGILVRKCKPLFQKEFGGYPSAITSDFYLFRKEFKKWRNIVYLDIDTLVRASLNELTKIKGFGAVNIELGTRLKECFVDEKSLDRKSKDYKIFQMLKKKYDLGSPRFRVSPLVFSTDIIKNGTFSKIIMLANKYESISVCGDESILNLHFYKRWKHISGVYNVFADHYTRVCKIEPSKLRGIIIHHMGSSKPWNKESPFFEEWRYYLEQADNANFSAIKSPVKKWTQREITFYSLYLSMNDFFYLLDKYIGLIGIYLRKKLLAFYFRPR